jgi:hypothetical protein
MEKTCKYFLKLVYNLKEIFTNVNDLKYESINIILMIINTDILISKQIQDGGELKLLQALAADETGCVNLLIKNDKIRYAQIGKELIIRNCKISIMNSQQIYLICDENSTIFETKEMIKIPSLDVLDLNYSKLKLNQLNQNFI